MQNWSTTESKFELLNLLQYSQSRSRRRSRSRRPKPSKMGRLRNTSQIFSFLTVWLSPSHNIKYIYQVPGGYPRLPPEMLQYNRTQRVLQSSGSGSEEPEYFSRDLLSIFYFAGGRGGVFNGTVSEDFRPLFVALKTLPMDPI